MIANKIVHPFKNYISWKTKAFSFDCKSFTLLCGSKNTLLSSMVTIKCIYVFSLLFMKLTAIKVMHIIRGCALHILQHFLLLSVTLYAVYCKTQSKSKQSPKRVSPFEITAQWQNTSKITTKEKQQQKQNEWQFIVANSCNSKKSGKREIHTGKRIKFALLRTYVVMQIKVLYFEKVKYTEIKRFVDCKMYVTKRKSTKVDALKQWELSVIESIVYLLFVCFRKANRRIHNRTFSFAIHCSSALNGAFCSRFQTFIVSLFISLKSREWCFLQNEFENINWTEKWNIAFNLIYEMAYFISIRQKMIWTC